MANDDDDHRILSSIKSNDENDNDQADLKKFKEESMKDMLLQYQTCSLQEKIPFELSSAIIKIINDCRNLYVNHENFDKLSAKLINLARNYPQLEPLITFWQLNLLFETKNIKKIEKLIDKLIYTTIRPFKVISKKKKILKKNDKNPYNIYIYMCILTIADIIRRNYLNQSLYYITPFIYLSNNNLFNLADLSDTSRYYLKEINFKIDDQKNIWWNILHSAELYLWLNQSSSVINMCLDIILQTQQVNVYQIKQQHHHHRATIDLNHPNTTLQSFLKIYLSNILPCTKNIFSFNYNIDIIRQVGEIMMAVSILNIDDITQDKFWSIIETYLNALIKNWDVNSIISLFKLNHHQSSSNNKSNKPNNDQQISIILNAIKTKYLFYVLETWMDILIKQISTLSLIPSISYPKCYPRLMNINNKIQLYTEEEEEEEELATKHDINNSHSSNHWLHIPAPSYLLHNHDNPSIHISPLPSIYASNTIDNKQALLLQQKESLAKDHINNQTQDFHLWNEFYIMDNIISGFDIILKLLASNYQVESKQFPSIYDYIDYTCPSVYPFLYYIYIRQRLWYDITILKEIEAQKSQLLYINTFGRDGYDASLTESIKDKKIDKLLIKKL